MFSKASPDFLKQLEQALKILLLKVRRHLHLVTKSNARRRKKPYEKLLSGKENPVLSAQQNSTSLTVHNGVTEVDKQQPYGSASSNEEQKSSIAISQDKRKPSNLKDKQILSITIAEEISPTTNQKRDQIPPAVSQKEELPTPDPKERGIPLVAIAEEKIPPIVSPKEERKQNKPKDGAGDSLSSSKPSTTIVIEDSDDDDDDDDKDTILLPVPTASQPRSLSGDLAEFERYIDIAAAAGNNFILPPRQEKFRNETDVRECLTHLLPGSGSSYWLDRNLVFAILSKLLPNQASVLSQESAPSEPVVQNMINRHDFDGVTFLVVPYALHLHWRVAVVNIPRRAITTIDAPNGQKWATCLGQAIDMKLGGPKNEGWQWAHKPLYPYRNGDSTNCGTMICHNVEAEVLGKPVEDIPFRELRLRYLRLIVQSYEVEPRSSAFLSQLGFNPSQKRKRDKRDVSGEPVVPCSRYLNMGRPQQLLEGPVKIEIVENGEIATKTSGSTKRAGLDGSLVPNILLEMQRDLPVKKCLRVIQYACQIGSAEVFQTLKKLLMGKSTCLPALPHNDLTMVFLHLDLIQKKSNDHVELARKRWELYYLYDKFDISVQAEREKKRIKRKANEASVNGSHQTAEHIVRQRIFQGMRDAKAGRPQNSATGDETDLVKDFNHYLNESLLSENLLNGKKIAQFFDGYDKPDLFLLLLFPSDQVLPPRLDLADAFPEYKRSLSKPIHAKEWVIYYSLTRDDSNNLTGFLSSLYS